MATMVTPKTCALVERIWQSEISSSETLSQHYRSKDALAIEKSLAPKLEREGWRMVLFA